MLLTAGALFAGTAGCTDGSESPEDDGTDESPDDPVTAKPDGETAEWTYDVGAEPNAVHDGRVYATENFDEGTGGPVAIDVESGDREWAYGEAGGYSSYTHPVVADALYFGYGDDAVGSGNGSLHAVEHDGEERWTVDTGSVYDRPAHVDGTVYATADDGTAFAVDADSGSRRWTFEPDDESPHPPSLGAVRNGVVYVGLEAGLVALDAAAGERLWRFGDDSDRRVSDPVVDGAVVYVGDGGDLVAIEDGEERWRTPAGGFPIAVRDGSVYVRESEGVCAFATDDGDEQWCASAASVLGVGDRGLYCSAGDPATTLRHVTHGGDTGWETDLDGELRDVSVDGEAVYAAAERTIYRLDAGGEPVASESVGDIHGHVVGDAVYVGTDEELSRLDL